MEINLLGIIPIGDIYAVNLWVVLNVIAIMSNLVATEPYLNLGKIKYAVWVIYIVLTIITFQINVILGVAGYVITSLCAVLYFTSAYSGYVDWKHLENT